MPAHRPWAVKPPPSVAFRPPRRLADGLLSFWDYRSVGLRTAVPDLVGPNTLDSFSGPAWVPGSYQAPALSYSIFSYTRKDSPTGADSTPISVVVWFTLTANASANLNRVAGHAQSGTTAGWQIFVLDFGPTNGLRFSAFSGAGATSLGVAGPAMALYQPQCVGFTFDGTTLVGYHAGRAVGSDGNGVGAITTINTPLYIGGGLDASRGLNGYVEQAALYQRVLSPDEMAWIARDPFVFYGNGSRGARWAALETLAPALVFPLDAETAASPVVFRWRSALQPNGRPVHFRVQVDPDDEAFDPADYERDSAVSQTGFEYDTSLASDGSGTWAALPSTGLAYANQGRQVRVSQSLPTGTYRWRVRQEPA